MCSINVWEHQLHVETEEVTFEIEKGAVRKFAESIGDHNPLYYDEEYAKTTAFGTIIAPPHFCCHFSRKTKNDHERNTRNKSPWRTRILLLWTIESRNENKM